MKEGMAVTWRISRIRFLVGCLVLTLLFSMVGCQGPKEQSGSELLDEEQVSTLESLYGEKMPDVLEAFSLDQGDVAEDTTSTGVWNIQAPVKWGGKDFLQSLLFDGTSNTLYGRRYEYYPETAEEAQVVIDDLLEQAGNLYGQPTTYPGENCLSNENFAESFSSAMESGERVTWREEWTAGEKTRCILRVVVGDIDTAQISVEYGVMVNQGTTVEYRDGN